MKKAIIYFTLAIALTGSSFADVKIKSKQTTGGQITENTTYIKGKRQRTEMAGGLLISITQCDLRRDLQLDPQTRSYSVSYYADAYGNPTVPVSQSASASVTQGGIVTVTTTIRDTGERKQMFGYTARHIIQTMEMESSSDACFPQKTKMHSDMWVIDDDFGLACTQNISSRSYDGGKAVGCHDKFISKTIGTAKSGYPLYQKMTSFDASGKETFSMLQEVVELSNTILDAALFEAPADYRKVNDPSMLYAASPRSTNSTGPSRMDSKSLIPDISGSNSDNSPAVVNSSIKTAEQQPSLPVNVGPKRAGTVRVGLIVKTGAVGEGIAANDLAKAVENTFGRSLKGSKVEFVPITGTFVSAQSTEAKEKECDYIMTATASHRKGGGGFGGFGKMLGSVVSQTGIGHTGSTVGNIAGQMATTAIVAATLSENVKAKDELTLDVTLTNSTNETSALSKQFKAKAKGDGDDIVSIAIKQAVQAIVDTVGR